MASSVSSEASVETTELPVAREGLTAFSLDRGGEENPAAAAELNEA
jgi:hypothetical protein